MVNVLHLLATSGCLQEEVVFSIACGLSRVVALSRGVASAVGSDAVWELSAAAAFYENAVLLVLLCDGCRYDGRGLSAVALDELLWSLGYLRSAVAWSRMRAKSRRVEERLNFAAVLSQLRSPPFSWWLRGDSSEERELFGRPDRCHVTFRGLCVGFGRLWTGFSSGSSLGGSSGLSEVSSSLLMPLCQLDAEPTQFSQIEVLDTTCSWRRVVGQCCDGAFVAAADADLDDCQRLCEEEPSCNFVNHRKHAPRRCVLRNSCSVPRLADGWSTYARNIDCVGRRPAWTAHAGPCSRAPPGRVGLFLPISIRYVDSLTHLTDMFTWLVPALSWFYGGHRASRLLKALWRQGGLPQPVPTRLQPETTEVIFVPVFGTERLPGRVSAPQRSRFRDILKILSPLSLKSLEDVEGCRCYDAALWGYVDPSLRTYGDVDRSFTAGISAAFRGHVNWLQMRSPSIFLTPLLRRLVRQGWRVRPTPKRLDVEGSRWRAGVIFSERFFRPKVETLQVSLHGMRNLTNRHEVSVALSNLVDQEPPLLLLEGAYSSLRLVDQVLVTLEFVNIMIQPFGAGLSWSTLLPAGSYVVELQDDAVATPHFVSCFPPSTGGGSSRSPWWPPTNPRSEWGAWALMNGVNHACVARIPTGDHCARNPYPKLWDTPTITADVGTIVWLVSDAASRLQPSRPPEQRGSRTGVEASR
eukprot:TRINITY_DN27662_c0_g1_i1.p1 TRINITY_DN27662_c0_g1~~TRINITY_DN27662_c0_g1_i1.p1  ORF type:complete len:768 (+),score=72.99 TRINITY_DN27662_c0_g1_i1:220-2304(+)